ncbi:cytochrome P450 [Nonomuraea sp. NPDC052129]|uniref:cytochrome P450 n=1 Tax=Nonomuraea sp. NPDC052129 TaxID=3154651 RepID=UPI003426022C
MTRRPGCPFDPPEELGHLRAEHPVAPLAYPDGHIGWLVTRRDLVREVLADKRFSHRAELIHSPFAGSALSAKPQPAPPGGFISMDPPEHTRYRQLLTGQFTVRRMRQLTGRIEQITAEHLDAMERHGPPVDLVEAFAQPLPALMICELLGVPTADRAEFQHHTAVLGGMGKTPEEKVAALTVVQGYMRDLVVAKRAEPTDDLFSGLANDSDLTDDELSVIGVILLGAGLDTTANMLALSAFALMSHPDQLAFLRADAGKAVEQLLRYLSIVPGLSRAALEDVELGGQLIKAGQTVTVSIPAANHDPHQFADPDVLDLSSPATGHVTFGHGVHQCLGQQLARVELQVGLPALFERFPTLRLDVPAEEVPLRTDMMIHGVHRLPVTWDVV